MKRSYGIAMIGFALCREEGGARGGGHDRHHAAFRRAGRTFSQKTTQSVGRTGDPMAAMVRANRGRARWRRRRIVDDAPPRLLRRRRPNDRRRRRSLAPPSCGITSVACQAGRRPAAPSPATECAAARKRQRRRTAAIVAAPPPPILPCVTESGARAIA